MPLNIVQVSSTEQAAIRRALQVFLTAHPEFKNQLHGIKITRKKYDVGLDEKIRKVFFPTLDNHGNRIIDAFNCPVDLLDDTQPTNGHSCTLIQQHGMLKMVYPQNRMEQNSLEYYKDVNLNRELTVAKIKVKHAAVYDYKTKKQETEIIYKSNFPYKTSSVLEDSSDPTIIQRYQDIYWSKSLKKSYNATNSQTDKTIQFMFDAGKNIKINPLVWISLETIAWKMLIALAELQAAGLIHGDIKPENICYKQHPCIENAEAAIIRIIDFESLQTITDLVPFTLFTPGYIAPELFQSNQVKSPQEQTRMGIAEIEASLAKEATLTFATDLFAMGATLQELFTTNKLTGSAILSELVQKMLSSNPSERPDLAFCFKLTTTPNPHLSQHSLPDYQLYQIHYFGNINRLLTLTIAGQLAVKQARRKQMEQDPHLLTHIQMAASLLRHRWHSSQELYALVCSYQPFRFLSRKVYEYLNFLAEMKRQEEDRYDREAIYIPPTPSPEPEQEPSNNVQNMTSIPVNPSSLIKPIPQTFFYFQQPVYPEVGVTNNAAPPKTSKIFGVSALWKKFDKVHNDNLNNNHMNQNTWKKSDKVHNDNLNNNHMNQNT